MDAFGEMQFSINRGQHFLQCSSVRAKAVRKEFFQKKLLKMELSGKFQVRLGPPLLCCQWVESGPRWRGRQVGDYRVIAKKMLKLLVSLRRHARLRVVSERESRTLRREVEVNTFSVEIGAHKDGEIMLSTLLCKVLCELCQPPWAKKRFDGRRDSVYV
ncbi:hypothetical protein DXK93_30670 [Achromobacter sp. K91]|nr:hypothetical protein DXK93_30670 [Achromobacter sp. K91]